MSPFLRTTLLIAGAAAAAASTGCAMVPKSRLDASQAYAADLQRKNQQVCAQYENLRLQNQELANRSQDTEDRLAEQDRLLAGWQQQASDWDQQRSRLSQLADSGQGSPLPGTVRKRLAEFARNHPDFVEVDPENGISKFKSDVLFRKGEAELSPDSQRVLGEFASIFSTGAGQALNIMVVGHADETPIVRPETRNRFASNDELSAARAIAVTKYLRTAGIDARRIGFAGYGEYQPLASGRSKETLAQNRRVEIYVVPPDATLVGRSDSQRFTQ